MTETSKFKVQSLKELSSSKLRKYVFALRMS